MVFSCAALLVVVQTCCSQLRLLKPVGGVVAAFCAAVPRAADPPRCVWLFPLGLLHFLLDLRGGAQVALLRVERLDLTAQLVVGPCEGGCTSCM